VHWRIASSKPRVHLGEPMEDIGADGAVGGPGIAAATEYS